MNTSPNEQLLILTQEMLASAEAGDWEKLAELEKNRLPLFHQVFDQGISGIEKLARQVFLMDEKTMSLAKAGRPALQEDILKMRDSGKANSAYQAIQNLPSGHK